MRLLHATTLEFHSFLGDKKPLYAILSHTWGSDEVLYEDARHGGEALRKCQWFRRGWTLQELIAPIDVDFYDSTWTRFGRRAELLAEIFDITSIDTPLLRRQHVFECHRRSLVGQGPRHTNESYAIRTCYMCRNLFSNPSQGWETNRQALKLQLAEYGISNRMSWAAQRETTRAEDIAYCLLGIFNVNMPLLYGEGGVRAFQRLQQEIIRLDPLTDHTLLTWRGVLTRSDYNTGFPGLAASPRLFSEGRLYRPVPLAKRSPMIFSNRGVELDVYLTRCTAWYPERQLWIAVLNCIQTDNYFNSPALIVEATPTSSNSFQRAASWKGESQMHEYVVSISGGLNRNHQIVDIHEDVRAIFPWAVNSIGKKIPHTTLIDPSALKKTRILLEEPDLRAPLVRRAQSEAPHACIICPEGLIHRYHIWSTIRQDGSSPIKARDILSGSKIEWLGEGNHVIETYGMAILFADQERHSFLVMWGIQYPGMDYHRLAFEDDDGWCSEQVMPFCKIRSSDPGTLTEDCLGQRYEEDPEREMERVFGLVMNGYSCSRSSISSKDSLTLPLLDGESIHVKAEINIERFMRRARFLISVSMQKAWGLEV